MSKAIRLIVSFILVVTTYFIPIDEMYKVIIYAIALFVAGIDVFIESIKRIFSGEFIDETFLMSLATIGSFAIGEYVDGVAVMLFYQLGEILQDKAVSKSRKSISSLMDLRPDYANLVIGNDIKTVLPDDLNIKDIVLVKPGEKVPVDGIIIEGSSSVDTSKLTGESVPRDVTVNDELLSGTINLTGLIRMEVRKKCDESTASKILELVENASMSKAKSEKFITKFANFYTPIVVVLAILLAFIPPLFLGFNEHFSEWLYRALTFLVVSCPCALVISIPLGFFAGIGACAKYNVLVKGSNYIEVLANTKTVVFDKTGTLTKGNFKVTSFDTNNKDKLLSIACSAEAYSNHPIARALKEAYHGEIKKTSNITDIVGFGIKAVIDSKVAVCGNEKLMIKEKIDYRKNNSIGTIVYVAYDDKFLGSIVISDEVKDTSKEALSDLHALGIKNLVMLTGDSQEVALNVANELNIDKVYSNLLPADKVDKVKEILIPDKKNNLAFVGDGINDAPVLALSDIGISMGGIGSDAAVEASDVVLMNDDLRHIAKGIKISRSTMRTVYQNIVFAIGIKVIVLILSAIGITNMWMAIFADVGVCLLAILNSVSILLRKR